MNKMRLSLVSSNLEMLAFFTNQRSKYRLLFELRQINNYKNCQKWLLTLGILLWSKMTLKVVDNGWCVSKQKKKAIIWWESVFIIITLCVVSNKDCWCWKKKNKITSTTKQHFRSVFDIMYTLEFEIIFLTELWRPG